jgi:hypothetical protein
MTTSNLKNLCVARHLLLGGRPVVENAGHVRGTVQVLAAAVHQVQAVPAQRPVRGGRRPIVNDGSVRTVRRYCAEKIIAVEKNEPIKYMLISFLLGSVFCISQTCIIFLLGSAFCISQICTTLYCYVFRF